MDTSKCFFCNVYRNEKDNIIYEDAYFWSQLDDFPQSPGQALIVSKRHLPTFFDMNDNEKKSFVSAVYNVVDKVREMINNGDLKRFYERFVKNPRNEFSRQRCIDILEHPNFGNMPEENGVMNCNGFFNSGQPAGQTIMHFHFHYMPRYMNDVTDPVGGGRNILPGGDYRK